MAVLRGTPSPLKQYSNTGCMSIIHFTRKRRFFNFSAIIWGSLTPYQMLDCQLPFRNNAVFKPTYIRNPIKKHPSTLTISVPQANPGPNSSWTSLLIPQRQRAPSAPAVAIQINCGIFVSTTPCCYYKNRYSPNTPK